MVHANESLKIEFTGKNVGEFIQSEDKTSCSICGRAHGEDSVIYLNDEAKIGFVKIVEISFEIGGVEYHFPICTEHLKMFQGIVSAVVHNSQAETCGVSVTKY
jgi:hypothetical protein